MPTRALAVIKLDRYLICGVLGFPMSYTGTVGDVFLKMTLTIYNE